MITPNPTKSTCLVLCLNCIKQKMGCDCYFVNFFKHYFFPKMRSVIYMYFLFTSNFRDTGFIFACFLLWKILINQKIHWQLKINFSSKRQMFAWLPTIFKWVFSEILHTEHLKTGTNVQTTIKSHAIVRNESSS